MAGLLQKPKHGDIAVVLGNEVLRSGVASDRLKARLSCALALYQSGIVPRILVSGGVGKSGFSEAIVMRDFLIHQGVPERDIVTDETGINTMATALHAAALAQKDGMKHVVIVSQYYHLPRSLLAFRKAGLTSLSAAHPDYFEWFDLYAIARESVALPVYFTKMPDKK